MLVVIDGECGRGQVFGGATIIVYGKGQPNLLNPALNRDIGERSRAVRRSRRCGQERAGIENGGELLPHAAF
jgi:hypothetical protein